MVKLLLVLLFGFASCLEMNYYISADLVEWDYGPDLYDLFSGADFVGSDAEVFLVHSDATTVTPRIGSIYWKALYREYTDESFTDLKPVPVADAHKGILGPIIRASVGDTIKCTFRNNIQQFPTSMHPHGVFYDRGSEGALYGPADPANPDGNSVAYGDTYQYIWPVPERAGPTSRGLSSVFWQYHSHVDESADVNSGLIGGMVITARDHSIRDLDNIPRPMDVDREMFVLYTIFDESANHLTEYNMNAYLMVNTQVAIDALLASDDFLESNLMHSINGYLFSNGPGYYMVEGERVRWYVLGMGNEVDLHTPHWHGSTLIIGDRRVDVASVLPAEVVVGDMQPDNVGTWVMHCHVDDHIGGGMIGLFTIADGGIQGGTHALCHHDEREQCDSLVTACESAAGGCPVAANGYLDHLCDSATCAAFGGVAAGTPSLAWSSLAACFDQCRIIELIDLEVMNQRLSDIELTLTTCDPCLLSGGGAGGGGGGGGGGGYPKMALR